MTGDHSYYRGLAVLAAVWALVATVACLFAEPILRAQQLSRFWEVLASTALYAGPVCLWTWAILCAFAGFSRREPAPRLLSIAINSGQCLPAIVLFSYGAPVALAAVLALGVNATYALLFLLRGPEDRPGRRALAFALALGFQWALCLRVLHEHMLADLGLELGIVAGFTLFQSFGWRLPSPRTSWRNSLASVAVTVLLLGWLSFSGRLPRVAAAPIPKPKPPARLTGAGRDGAPGSVETVVNSALPGVILWPEVLKTTALVAPLPVWAALAGGALARDASIPFSGEYWIFEPPHRRPPPASVLQRGSPLKQSFHTVDGNPLLMEAHQKLPVDVAMSCCRAIELHVRNEDSQRGLLLLELILVNGDRRVSLGAQPAGAAPLTYAMPKSPPFPAFDEIGIVYRREPVPLGHSARLAIERFVLVR